MRSCILLYDLFPFRKFTLKEPFLSKEAWTK